MTLRTLAPVVVLVAGILTLAALFPRSRARKDCGGPLLIGLISEEQPPTLYDRLWEFVPHVSPRC